MKLRKYTVYFILAMVLVGGNNIHLNDNGMEQTSNCWCLDHIF
jgi:hypothetical protein